MPPDVDARQHPASIAWMALHPGSARPRAVQKLQEKAKGSVYRLERAGPRGEAVIAKRSTVDRIRQERAAYEELLPKLAVRTVRYHGALDDVDCGWIFVEDAGGEPYAPTEAVHRELAGAWLGALHLAGARLSASAEVAERGAAYHFAQLMTARSLLERNLDNPALTRDDVAVARSLVGQCDVLATRWDGIETLCGALPCTIVHGDFAPKNMRVRASDAGPLLLPFDWGSAGRGPAAADLVQWSGRTASQWGYWANPNLATYAATVRHAWPELDVSKLRQAAAAGKLFRCLVCIALSAQSYATPWVERAALNMRTYAAELADALDALEWSTGGAR